MFPVEAGDGQGRGLRRARAGRRRPGAGARGWAAAARGTAVCRALAGGLGRPGARGTGGDGSQWHTSPVARRARAEGSLAAARPVRQPSPAPPRAGPAPGAAAAAALARMGERSAICETFRPSPRRRRRFRFRLRTARGLPRPDPPRGSHSPSARPHSVLKLPTSAPARRDRGGGSAQGTRGEAHVGAIGPGGGAAGLARRRGTGRRFSSHSGYLFHSCGAPPSTLC